MAATSGSLKALDWVNLFMADVRDGVGVYLSVFLLTVRDWDPGQIGLVIAIPGLIGLVAQPPAGALIDHSRYKRLILVIASLIIAGCCLVIIMSGEFYPVLLSQAMLGLTQSVYAPCVAAISLGMVGHALLDKRIGRNESFNHLGNMLAAIIAGLLGRFISYEAIFYFSIFQCLILVVAVLSIREKDIDHDLARAADTSNAAATDGTGMLSLLTNRTILFFTLSMALFHLANGAMLPLVDKNNSSLYLSAAIIIAQGVMVFVANFSGKASEKGRKKVMLIAFALLPIRAVLFAFIKSPYALTAIQLLDGIGAGIFGVVSILMIADLSQGTGRFNLLQGVVYSAIGLGAAVSSIIGGWLVKQFGYSVGFFSLAGIGVLGALFFLWLVPETKTLKSKEKAPGDAPIPYPAS